jgi:molecular chaperone Hsp33
MDDDKRIIISLRVELSIKDMKQQDCLRRFIFEQHNVRGEWVRLQDSWQQAKQHQVLVNDAVGSQLGQALAAVTLLSATIKFKGAVIMQFQGGGDLRMLVAQASNERKIRGLVRSNQQVAGDNLKQMLGEGGRLVLTVEPDASDPFQGVISIDSESLAEVLTDYFVHSEQLDTRLWLFANQTHAAGLFIQELPGENKDNDNDNDNDKDDWDRIEMLANTVTAEEMFSLDCEELLHRLFHEEEVRLYEPESVEFQCNCSREKISGTLQALGRSELEEIVQQQGDIEVDCQFCGAHYDFDKVDVAGMLSNIPMELPLSETRH